MQKAGEMSGEEMDQDKLSHKGIRSSRERNRVYREILRRRDWKGKTTPGSSEKKATEENERGKQMQGLRPETNTKQSIKASKPWSLLHSPECG